MKTIQNRLAKIEQALSIGEERLCVRITISRLDDSPFIESLGPIEQWETYKQAEAQDPDATIMVFRADPQLEIEARKRIQNETERNKNAKCLNADGQTA
ncbi:MAG: hypothetical protein WC454_06475 [Phycisphaerae bacterium]|jgi:hypothetical protein